MANLNLNKVILAGRLTADAELKQTTSGISVTSFTVAVSRKFAKQGDAAQADFINCVAWRQQAEFITKYFRKGSSICIIGNIQTRSWTDNQGAKRYATEVIVDEVNFVDSKSERDAGAPSAFNPDSMTPPPEANSPAYASAPTDTANFEEVADDDDLPF